MPHPLRIAVAAAFVLIAGSWAAAAKSGSGFGIGNGSLIITNNHVIEGCSTINIAETGIARIVQSDARDDIAILKSANAIDKGLPFRSGRQVRLGEEVIVIGYPSRGVLASPPTVTTGIVSSLAGMRDDRTRMQISAPVQPGNSGGPVLDRSGNIVGMVVSKLDALGAARITGDIPQNVNFAIHASIITSLLDSYSLDYTSNSSQQEKSVAEIVASALPAVVDLECKTEVSPSLAEGEPRVRGDEARGIRSSVLCGRPVNYEVNAADSDGPDRRFLGVWSGVWKSSSRICGALIVEKIVNGAADVTYIYGPSNLGAGLPWRRQRAIGVIRTDGSLFFKDDQGSLFAFFLGDTGTLNAMFSGATGRLRATFEKVH